MGLQVLGAKITMGVSLLIVLCWWKLAMQTTGWTAKATPWYSVNLGLLYVDVSGGLYGAAVSSVLPNALTEWVRTVFSPKLRTTEEFKEFVCGLPAVPGSATMGHGTAVCQIATGIHIGSVVMLLAIFFGTTLNLTGTIFIGIWTFGKPRSILRLWGKIFYLTSLFVMFLGTGIFFWYASAMSSMPPVNQGITIGPCGIGACLLLAFSFLPLIFVFLFVSATEEEVLNEGISAQKKLLKEQEDTNYGSAEAQSAPSQFPFPQPVNAGFVPPMMGGPPMADAYYQGQQQPVMMSGDGMLQQPFPGQQQPFPGQQQPWSQP